MHRIEPSLNAYIEAEILPRYRAFDSAHRPDHARTVIRQSLRLALRYPETDPATVYAAAAYHDTGLVAGRERHHIVSGEIVAADRALARWFDPQRIALIREAVEDHRASAERPPRSIYGRIVAEADRIIDPQVTLRRTVQYGLEHCPGANEAEQYARFRRHLTDKYGEGGYLKLWIPHSPNSARLMAFRRLLADETALRAAFGRIYREERTRFR